MILNKESRFRLLLDWSSVPKKTLPLGGSSCFLIYRSPKRTYFLCKPDGDENTNCVSSFNFQDWKYPNLPANSSIEFFFPLKY